MGQFQMIKSVDLSSFFLMVTNGSVSNDHKLELILIPRSKVLTFLPSSLAFETLEVTNVVIYIYALMHAEITRIATGRTTSRTTGHFLLKVSNFVQLMA